MKTEDIHNGLDKKEVRDFLGRELQKLSLVTSIPARIEEKIAELEQELKECRRKQALLKLIDYFGWKELDLSDEVSDYNWETHIEFIGTEEEFDTVIERNQQKHDILKVDGREEKSEKSPHESRLEFILQDMCKSVLEWWEENKDNVRKPDFVTIAKGNIKL